MASSRFSEFFVRENALAERGFKRWAFYPEMLFGAGGKWWSDRGRRDQPHPGLDLCAFANARDEVIWIGEKACVPAIHHGQVVALIDDFLGRTVVVEHPLPGDGDARFCALYAHTEPRPGLCVGSPVAEGEVIAAVAGTAGAKSGIRAHLHLSLGRISGRVQYDELDWKTVGSLDALRLIDPLPFLELPHVVRRRYRTSSRRRDR